VTRVRNSAFRENRETVIDDNELNKALKQARAIDNEYFRLRALAVLSLLARARALKLKKQLTSFLFCYSIN
jgi:hypothetical protein